MKITSREPVVVHSHFLVDATGHHLVVVIDIMYQECFIQNWREPTFSIMFVRSFWVLPAQQIRQCLVISVLLPICSLLSRYNILAPSLKSVLINHPDTTALISPEKLFWYSEAFLRTLLVQ